MVRHLSTILIVVSVACLIAALTYQVLSLDANHPNCCTMTYMYPNYEKIPVTQSDTAYRYGLYRYYDGAVSPSSIVGTHVQFLNQPIID